MAATPVPVVRDLRWEDFDDLAATYFLLYDERAAGEPIGITLQAERPSLAEEMAWFTAVFRKTLDGTTVGAVAEVDGRTVGSCFVNRLGIGPTSEQSHVGELGLLVRRGFRGRGVGSALLREVLRRCRGRFEMVRLSVFATNEGAKRLYRSFGFQTVGVHPRAIKRGTSYIDEEWMLLTL